ncbi:undecaprenyl-diphosphate phosphatase [Sulfurimonas sp. HSL-1656]|uniref:undecaprenyl-diphosphate phosphatase n=1 Tax=Thiomicrolovo subterrani TaxID=3131934 RepID=UPI0031F7DB18
MTVFDAIILGIVEGITEYLPVSSTAHLYLAGQMLGLKQDTFLTAFEIIIQIAPIFSVMLIYRERLLQSRALWVKLIAAFIPTGVVGLLFHKQIEAMFAANSTVALMILTGIAFLAVEFAYKPKTHAVKALEGVSMKQALAVGIFQVFALVPGVSRSGMTILGGMLSGLSRDTAMAFSFLLAIPTMGAASGYTLLKEYSALSFEHFGALAVGFVVSFVVGWVAVKTFLAVVSRYSFKPFGVYLIASGLLYGLFGVELVH